MKKVFRSIFKFFKMSLIFILCFELGLSIRAQLIDIEFKKKLSSKGSINIVSIGDSVLGTTSDSITIAYNLKQKLVRHFSDKINFVDRSEPALSSWLANKKSEEYLTQLSPNAVIIMLGNSDYILFKDSSNFIKFESLKYYDFLKKFRSIKLIYNAITELINKNIIGSEILKNKAPRGISAYELANKETRKKFEKISNCRKEIIEPNLDNQTVLSKIKNCLDNKKYHLNEEIAYLTGILENENKNFSMAAFCNEQSILKKYKVNSARRNLFWLYIRDDYKKALRVFEEILATGEPNRRMMLEARTAYIRLGLLKQGEAAFASFIERKVGVSYLTDLALQILNSIKFLQNKKTEIPELESIKNSDEYINMLFNYKNANKPKKANDLFRKLDYVPVMEDHLPDTKNLSQLIEKFTSRNIKVFLAQYPNQSIWPLAQLVDPFNQNVYLINLNEKLLPYLDEVPVTNIFSDDFMHVSEQGGKLIGEILAKEIIEKLGR